MRKPLIIYCNVPTFKEWPTNFKLLFQALYMYTLVLLAYTMKQLIHDRCMHITGYLLICINVRHLISLYCTPLVQ